MISVETTQPGSFMDAAKKSQHNVVFAAWLVHIFGQETLRRNGGVMDIAGGNGLLSYELSVRYGIFCTVIDPRAVRLNAIRRRNIRKITKKRLALSAEPLMVSSPADIQIENETPLADKYVIVLLKNVGILASDDGHILPSVTQAIEDREILPFAHIRQEFHPAFAFGTTSLMVGMHPDLATEYIVDTALRLGISFAVVPCCVFANQFPDRKTRDGELVKTYEDFITYLQEKDWSIKCASLPFMGRNTVLYRDVESRVG